MPVRLGILGAAAIAPTAVITPAFDSKDIVVQAVAARDRVRAQAFAEEYGIPVVHESYQALIDDPTIDAVYVPTPAALHGTWTMQAIAAGKHVLCEKPFTANADEAAAVHRAARDAGVVVMEAMHSLYHPLWETTRNAIEDGDIGQVQEASAVFDVAIPDPADIRWNLSLGGGALMDLGVYPLTLLHYLFGDLELQSAQAESVDGVDSSFQALYRDPQGANIGLFTRMDAGTTEVQRLVVRGSQGFLTLDGFVHPQRGGTLTVERDGERRVIEASGLSSYAVMLNAFAQAVANGASIPTDSRHAVKTMQQIDELYRSAGMEPRQPFTL